MSSTHRIDREAFLANLRKSNLLAPERYDAVVAELPDTERSLSLARALVKRGVLTKFQAEMLLAGRTGGFTLGQYRVLDQLGRGGMGRVFKAIHQTMNRVVALKVVSSRLLKTDKAQKMFQREVRAAARLLHPNIVTAYDANQIGERHYMVMEFVDGPNLEQLVRDKGPLSVGQACDFIRQAAMGLQYAHEMGMVHRDIKPANLLVQPVVVDGKATRCVVKILDFGLARLQDSNQADGGSLEGSIVTEQNTVMGTPDYLSPEQAHCLHTVDIRSDLYSLGCSMYYLLTGQLPFPDGTTLEKLMRHSTEEATPIEKLRPEVPPVVANIVRRLMAKKPEERHQTPAELAAALAPFALSEPPTWTSNKEDELADGPTPDGDSDNALAGTLPASSLTPMSDVSVPSRGPGGKPRRIRVITLVVSLLVALAVLAGLVVLLTGWRP